MAVVPSPGVRVTITETLIRDLDMVSEWCDLWGMKLSASKTKTFIVSRQGVRSERRTHGGNKCKHTRAGDVTRDNLAKNSL